MILKLNFNGGQLKKKKNWLFHKVEAKAGLRIAYSNQKLT